MRLGINTLFLIPGEVGGSETYFLETLSAMLEQEPRHHVVLYTNLENHELLNQRFSDQIESIEFRQTGIPATNRYSRILREQFQLPGMVRADRIDVLWSPGYTCPLRCSAKQLVSILDMQYRSHPEDLSLLARLTTDFLVRGAARVAEGLITISSFSATEIVRYTSSPADRISVTPLAASQAFSESTSDVSNIVHSPFLLCVANTYPHKNVAELVKAFSEIAPDYKHTLVILGKARRGERSVMQAIEDSACAERIIRLDGVSRDELIAMYHAADCFVFPSLYEGFGLPVLESMMAGTPVVTTRCGSIPEVAGDHVVYSDPPEAAGFAIALRKVLDLTPGERSEQVRLAMTWAGRFSWKKTAEKTLIALHKAHK